MTRQTAGGGAGACRLSGWALLLVALGGLLLSGVAQARTLTIGLRAAPDSLDPHYHNLAPNVQVSLHLFDGLVALDASQRPRPALAESWWPIDDSTWEVKLRRGVTFHDGSPFDAADVVASWRRVSMVHGPSPFTVFTEPVKRLEVIDPHTLRLFTDGPFPLLPVYLAMVMIVPSELAEAPSDDFDQGRAVVGTGPYRLVGWEPGKSVEMVPNPDHWGSPPAWDRLVFRFLPDDAGRVAALIAQQVDIIDAVPPADVRILSANPGVRVVSAVSSRVIYLSVDFDRSRTPFAMDGAGQPLPVNPFQDKRVRQAISAGINRQALVDELLYGQGVPAGQLVPETLAGAAADLPVEPHDPVRARRLLAEAGYPAGFTTVLHGPNNRYVRDQDVARAVALSLTGAGIATTAETMPAQTFFARNKDREFSFTLRGWSSDTGEAGFSVKALLATRNVAAGTGTGNHNRYSNPQVDALVAAADRSVDEGERRRLIARAMTIGMDDLGQIPLYFQKVSWAMRQGVTYEPRVDELTLAANAGLRP